METIKVTKLAITTIAISSIAACLFCAPVRAQQYPQAANGPRIRKDAREKVDYYHAPREIQIIDDRPVVRDFREAPQQEEGIDLPPGPSGNGGGGPGGGGGMDGAGPGTLPQGGMHIPGGGGQPGYRTPPGEGVPLPKSGFGRDTNIPARGMAPRESLPDATSTNRLMGKMMDPGVAKGIAAGPSKWQYNAPPRSSAAPKPSAPSAQTYNNNYAASGAGFGGTSGRTEGMVRGSLLRH